MGDVAHLSRVEISPPVVDGSHAPCRTLPESAGYRPRHVAAAKTRRVLDLLALGTMTTAAIADDAGCSRQHVRSVRLSGIRRVEHPPALLAAFPAGGPHDGVRLWFIDRVAFIDDATSCWRWTGSSSTKHGLTYGLLLENGRSLRANRVALEMSSGEMLPAGIHALHDCDNPICVRPSHLHPGTAKQNMEEKVARGRHRSNAPKGDDNWNSRIPDGDIPAIVDEIAKGPRGTTSAIARRYGVNPATISKIASGTLHRHVNRPERLKRSAFVPPAGMDAVSAIVAARIHGDACQAIGDRHGITRSRVRQILAKAARALAACEAAVTP